MRQSVKDNLTTVHMWHDGQRFESFDIPPEDEQLTLNIGGSIFAVSRISLRRFPRTKLGRLALSTSDTELYFDRNPKLFTCILDLYGTGELHLPRNVCSMAIKGELEFWDIPTMLVSECCWQPLMEGHQDVEVIDRIQRALADPYKGIRVKGRVRDFIWTTLNSDSETKAARVSNAFYNVLIIISVVLFFLESAAEFRYIPNVEIWKPFPPKKGSFRFIMYSVPYDNITYMDTSCWIYFTVEFLLKVIVCPRRKIFFRGFMNLLDLFLILVVWISIAMDECAVKRLCLGVKDTFQIFYIHTVLRYVTALRVVRVFHIIKRKEMTNVILLSIHSVGYSLSLLMVIIMLVAVIMGALFFVAEMQVENFPIRNLARAFWSTYMTMSAVGYGDVLPSTLAGYIVAIVTGCCGAILLAMPIAVVVNTFRTYLRHVRIQQHRMARQKYLSKYEISERSRALFTYLTKDLSSSSSDDEVDDVEADYISEDSDGYVERAKKIKSVHFEKKPKSSSVDPDIDVEAFLARRLVD